MADTNHYVYELAVDDRIEAHCSFTMDDQSRRFTGQFLARDKAGYWFDVSALPPGLAPQLASRNVTLSFEFGAENACAVFEADAADFDLQMLVDGEPRAALRCRAPQQVGVVQRRQNFRSIIAAPSPLSVVAWKVPPHWVLRDRPKPSAQLRVELLDLSIGGMCLTVLPNRVGRDSLAAGDRIRIELMFQETEAVLDSQIVYILGHDPGQPMRSGVAYRKLDSTIEGRRGLNILDRAIASLQRLTIKQTATTA